MTQNTSGWLSNLIGPVEIRDEATPITARPAIAFVGAGVTVNDDAAGARTVVTIPGGNEATAPLDVATTGTINNLPIADLSGNPVSAVRFTGAAPTLTGMVPLYPGQRVSLMAIGGPLILSNESGTSTAGYRFRTGTGANVTVPQDGSVWMVFDSVTQRWRSSGAAQPTVTIPDGVAGKLLALDGSGGIAASAYPVPPTTDGTYSLKMLGGVATWVTSGGGGAFDPTTLPYSGFWRGSFTASPWVGTASAGTSGTHNMSNGVAPGVGTAVDGFTPATFNGTTQYLTDAANPANVYISTTDYVISGVIKPTAAPAVTTVYSNPGILTETGGNFGVVYSSAGIQVYHASALVGTLPLGIGSWKSFDIKYTGGTLYMRLGSAAWTTFTGVPATGGISTNPFRIGSNFNAGAILNGSLMELQLALTAISDANLTSNYTARQARYPSMGL